MESTNLSKEDECLICLDLLVQPSTTMCGHTFCKRCLIQYLEKEQKCPMCRKPIFQSPDTLSTNFVLESIIKEKYPNQYNERLKSILNENQNNINESNEIKTNIPSIILENFYTYPNLIRSKIILKNDKKLLTTILNISVNDRVLLIIPSNNITQNMICSLCEIVEIHDLHNSNSIDVRFKGIKRIKLTSFNRNNVFDLSNGIPFIDNDIEDNEIKESLLRKLNDIVNFNSLILKNSPYSLTALIEKNFGPLPNIPSFFNEHNSLKIEGISLYFLSLLKDNNKIKYFETTNLKERIEFLHTKYKDIVKFKRNMSLPLIFYDIPTINSWEYSPKSIIIIILICLLFLILSKYGVIKKQHYYENYN